MRLRTRFIAAFSLLTISGFLFSCGVARFEQKNKPSNERGTGNPTNPDDPDHKPDDDKPRVAERFNQDAGGNKVDILVISDDSYSMEADQKKLGAKFSSFVSALSSIDWHVGVTTTDLDSDNALKGRLDEFLPGQQVLLNSTPNAQKLFEKTVVRKCNGMTCGSSNEQALGATVAAVNQAATVNQGFFRDNVDFAVLIITDEDEMSNGRSNRAVRPEAVVEVVKRAWGDKKKFSAYGIIIKPDDEKCLNEQTGTKLPRVNASASYGRYVDNLAKLTGGATYSICAKDYGPPLKEISNKIRKLVHSFQLQSEPKPGSLQVQLSPAQEIGYHMEGKNLVFDEAPAPSTQINVSYIPL